MGVINRRSIPPSSESVNELKRQSLRLEQVNTKLRERDHVLFDMIGKAVRRKDSLRAQIYANELSRVRHVKKVIAQSQLALDCITIRLENFIDLYDVIQEMKPVSQIVREVSVDVQKVLPDFALGLDQLNQIATETLAQTSINFKQPAIEEMFSLKSEESADILKEVSNMIESTLHESFPEPPMSTPIRAAETPIEATSSGFEPTFAQKKSSIIESTDWNTLSDEVVKMLDDYNSRGRVKLEEAVA